MTPAEKSMTIHSDDGMTPAAPCVRSRRATSRSDVWSSHFAYAVCSGMRLGIRSRGSS